MWTRRIIACLFSCSLITQLPADSNLAGIQLQLTQKPDIDCDGTPEETDHVSPGSCIIYEIVALNTDVKAHRNITVSARIPEQSILVHPYQRISDNTPIDSIIKQGANGIRLLKTQLETLQPGNENKIILHYSVRVL